MRIAILFHENECGRRLERYYITHLANHWREDGHNVDMVFGPEVVPADIAVVHVNLSVVPDAYLEAAARYPVSVNGRVGDIRKTTVSANLVREGDGYNGPVIVKANLNYGGRPERLLAAHPPGRFRRRLSRLRSHLKGSVHMGSQDEYRVYESFAEVPGSCFHDDGVVVEKFIPERDGDYYVIHNCHFLGDRVTGSCLWSQDPIITQQNIERSEREDSHPGIVALREAMGFDYGKFDYVMRDGEPILIDANKTTGAEDTTEPRKLERRRFMAEGLYSFIQE
jgi:hypothetical protein